jgi:hypothetical protein
MKTDWVQQAPLSLQRACVATARRDLELKSFVTAAWACILKPLFGLDVLGFTAVNKHSPLMESTQEKAVSP